MISKQQYETQLQQIFRLLLENKTQEEIAHELNISTRTVARYTQRIDKRYGEIQRQKNDDTIFLECQLLKNRMLKLYKALETKALDNKTSGVEVARLAETASYIATQIIKLESEGIRAVKELGLAKKATTAVAKKSNTNLNHLRNNGYDYDRAADNNNNNSHNHLEKEDDNRKF